MVFYLIGLGLGNEDDITVKGLKIVQKCTRIYLEAYTSILGVDKEKLEKAYGKEIILADREMVEQDSKSILENADVEDVCLLVVGDPFGATTHSDIYRRAVKNKIPCKIVHNASIMNAVGITGMQLYRFGYTISIVFFTDNWQPDSFYEHIASNKARGLHTLCLLDIKVKEQSIENLLKQNKIFEPPRYMTVNQAIKQLLLIEEKRKENICCEDSFGIGVARIGSEDQLIVSGTLKELLDVDFGGPLHSFILPGDMHPMEKKWFQHYAIKKEDK